MGRATWRTTEARYLIWLLCLAGAVAFNEFVPADRAYAAPSDSPLTYSPSSYSGRLLPGQQTTFQLAVTCNKNNITVSCPSLADAAPSQPIPTSWVSASPTTYTWSRPGTTNFAITISVPAGAAGGSYRSYIRCHVTKGGATDGTGCLTTITVDSPPVCSFTYAPAKPLIGQSVLFTDGSTDPDGSIASWSWNFGDGGTSTVKNPTHTYASYGTYTVSLTVTDNDGLTATSSQSVKVLSPPICGFTFSPAQPKAGQQVQFTDQSTDADGSIVSWAWNFGDGQTSTAQNPTHAYASTGTRTVSLTVTDNDGLTSTCSQSIVVLAALQPPVCGFTFSPANPRAGDQVQFTDQSTDSDGTVVSWSWNFGDGQTSTAQSPTHAYASTGTRTVSLTVTDNDGLTSTCSQNVVVLAALQPPACGFTFSPAQPRAGDQVQFTDQSTDSDGTVVSWSWNFGDGQTSTAQSPTHAYASTGTRTVSLTVTDNDGLTSTCSQNVVVLAALQPPACGFTFSPANPRAGDQVQFTDQSTDSDGTVVSWSWNFGDGQTSTAQSPTHSYSSAGTRTVSLTVTDNDGLTSTCSQNVVVLAALQPPACGFTFSPANPRAGDQVQFTDQSTDPDGNIVSWAWDFGDNTQSSEQNPTHAYAASGTYTVSLTVTDNDGLTSECSQEVEVAKPLEPPVCGFSFAPEEPVAGQNVQFTDQSSDADGSIVSWAWDFGDGTGSSEQSPTHAYSSAGTFTVQQTVTDNDGLTATCAHDLVVLKKRVCSFTYAPQSPTAGQEVTFTDQSSDPSEIVSWVWEFGDGATSGDQNPSHAYGDPGSYNVSLQITYNDGQEASCSQQLSVNSSTPAAEFSWRPPSPGEGQAVQFSDQSAGGGPKGAIVAWAWDFGDGGRAEVANPTHAFVDNGNYSVNLTVTNSYGLTATIAQVVSVHNLAPTCDAGPARVVQVGEQVTFTGQAVDPGVLDILSFSWDFGDGSSTTGQVVSHVYQKPGIYRVTLRVVDNDGAEGVDFAWIQARALESAGSPDEPEVAVAVQAEYDGNAASGPDGRLNLSARLTKVGDSAANPFWPARAVFSLITPRGDLAGRFYADVLKSSSGDGATARVNVQLPPGVYFAWVEMEGRVSCDSEQEPFGLIAVGADRNAIWGASRSVGDGQLSAAISVWDLDSAHPRAEVIYCVRGPAGSLRVFTGTSIQALSVAHGRVEISGVSAADGVHGLPFRVIADVFSSSLTIALADGTSASGTLDAGASTAP